MYIFACISVEILGQAISDGLRRPMKSKVVLQKSRSIVPKGVPMKSERETQLLG